MFSPLREAAIYGFIIAAKKSEKKKGKSREMVAKCF